MRNIKRLEIHGQISKGRKDQTKYSPRQVRSESHMMHEELGTASPPMTNGRYPWTRISLVKGLFVAQVSRSGDCFVALVLSQRQNVGGSAMAVMNHQPDGCSLSSIWRATLDNLLAPAS